MEQKSIKEKLNRGKGEFINCTDYDDALKLMEEYESLLSEKDSELSSYRSLLDGAVKTISEKNKEIGKLKLSVENMRSVAEARLDSCNDKEKQIYQLKSQLSQPAGNKIDLNEGYGSASMSLEEDEKGRAIDETMKALKVRTESKEAIEFEECPKCKALGSDDNCNECGGAGRVPIRIAKITKHK